MQAAPGGPLEPIIAGRYHDTFVRSHGEAGGEGQWEFRDRLIYSDLFGNLSRHLRANPYGG
jgi:hypothetical protein